MSALDPSRLFWPASPSTGAIEPALPSIESGDVHFWEFWHARKPIGTALAVRPRFVSEFGFQAWPSLHVIDAFQIGEDLHQRAPQGNEILREALLRDFGFGGGERGRSVYMSAVEQAIAVRTAAEFWRTLKPRCRGVLFWQLNDIWPCSSWSAIEFGGRWRQLAFHARRFFDPLLLTFQTDGEEVCCWLVSDLGEPVECSGTVELWDFGGRLVEAWQFQVQLAADSAEVVWRGSAPAAGRFLFGELGSGQTNFFTTSWRGLRRPAINVSRAGRTVTLSSDVPAFFVHLEAGSVHFSDSSVVLLPEHPMVLDADGDFAELSVQSLGDEGELIGLPAATPSEPAMEAPGEVLGTDELPAGE